MVKDKKRLCPRCANGMKFRGSRVWFCGSCKRSYHWIRLVEYQKDKDGKVKLSVFGKPKVKRWFVKESSWSSVR